MKRTSTFVLSMSVLVSLLLVGCQGETPAQPEAPGGAGAAELNVLAVHSFLADIAQNVAGDRLQVETLIPRGIDPHAYQPAPQEIARITDTQLLIINGGGFEEWLEDTLANAGGEFILIEASSGLQSRQAREGEEPVLSPEDIAETVCDLLHDQPDSEVILAGPDAASAAELRGDHANEADEHDVEMDVISLKLNPNNGSFGGFIKWDVEEHGEYVIAANSAVLAITSSSGEEIEAEEILPVDCLGLSGGILVDLEPGEYLVELSGLSVETTPFIVVPAGGHPHHDEGDPHFWLDPLNVIQYVENIRAGLSVLDPAGADSYTRNAAAYIAQLNELDAWINQQVSAIPADQRLIVTNHESFGYFADRYGFKIIGTIIPSVSSGASPSAQQMGRLVDRIRSAGVVAIFLETGANPQLAGQIAQETGVKVVSDLYTHSVTEAGGKAPSYIDMMKYNVRIIVEALK